MRFHQSEGAQITIAVTWQPNVARYGRAIVEGGKIVGFEEKGRSGSGWINAGAYLIPKTMQWPDGLPEKFSFEVDFLSPEIRRIAPAAYECRGFFLDIGVPEDLDRAQTELAAF
jgi:D-glycero-alpha-D-manno-heptose 1-phosphate guanylyltransferase